MNALPVTERVSRVWCVVTRRFPTGTPDLALETVGTRI